MVPTHTWPWEAALQSWMKSMEEEYGKVYAYLDSNTYPEGLLTNLLLNPPTRKQWLPGRRGAGIEAMP